MEMIDTAYALKIIESMQENMFAHMLFLPEQMTSCTVLRAQELTIINSHLDDARFNLAFKARLKENALDAIESTAAYFDREGVPFRWLVSPFDQPEELPHLLVEAGLHHVEKIIGMALSIEDFAYEQAELRVERVLDSAQLQDYAGIMIDAYGDTPAMLSWYNQLSLFDFDVHDAVQLYVGYLDEQPVSCGTITFHHDVVGLYDLATVRSQRRRGFATAMIQELLMRSQAAGYSVATAQAHANLLSLYEKVGFEALCEFDIFELKM